MPQIIYGTNSNPWPTASSAHCTSPSSLHHAAAFYAAEAYLFMRRQNARAASQPSAMPDVVGHGGEMDTLAATRSGLQFVRELCISFSKFLLL